MEKKRRVLIAFSSLAIIVSIIILLPYIIPEKIEIAPYSGNINGQKSLGFVITGHVYSRIPVTTAWEIVNLDHEVSSGGGPVTTDFFGNFDPIYTPSFISYQDGTPVQFHITMNESGSIIQQTFNVTYYRSAQS